MLRFICVCILASGALCDLESVLKSSRALLDSFQAYKNENDKSYKDGREMGKRLKLYKDTVKFVVSQNREHSGEWESGLNYMADLTPSERQQYLGFNASKILTDQMYEDSASLPPQSSLTSVPASFSWITLGAVTPPKDQAKCGSCWSFSSTAGLEAAYKVASGKLKNLAEQEYLDCVYPLAEKKNGCNGGFYHHAWDYNKKSARMGRYADRLYRAKPGQCTNLPENALKAHTVTGYIAMPKRNEADTLLGITKNVLSIAFEVTQTFTVYKGGILRDTTCHRGSNHAVAAVGYSPTYILVKNSWGTRWGDRGFVKFARNHHNCEMHRFTAYPTLKPTFRADKDKEDVGTVYDPENKEGPTDSYNPGPEPPCEDDKSWCAPVYCGKSYEKYCRKTCKLCGGDGGDCPQGTVKCQDGVCRHPHMC